MATTKITNKQLKVISSLDLNNQAIINSSIDTANSNIIKIDGVLIGEKFQDKLVGTQTTGQNIKTINNQTIMGSGNIDIEGAIYTAGAGIAIDADNKIISMTNAMITTITSKQDALSAENGIEIVNNSVPYENSILSVPTVRMTNAMVATIDGKQDTLIGTQTTGQNLKTVNGNTLLGTGDVTIETAALNEQEYTGITGTTLTTTGITLADKIVVYRNGQKLIKGSTADYTYTVGTSVITFAEALTADECISVWTTTVGLMKSQTVVTNPTSPLAIDGNTIYDFGSTAITSLTISSCATDYNESVIYFTTGASITFTDNAGINWIGGMPSLVANTDYVIAIANKVGAVGKVGA